MSDTNEPREAVSEDPWLTTGEAAEILGVSLPTVRRMTEEGILLFKRIPSWSSKGADRLGRELPGHRRVSRESVMRVKREHDRAAAELRRKPGS